VDVDIVNRLPGRRDRRGEIRITNSIHEPRDQRGLIIAWGHTLLSRNRTVNRKVGNLRRADFAAVSSSRFGSYTILRHCDQILLNPILFCELFDHRPQVGISEWFNFFRQVILFSWIQLKNLQKICRCDGGRDACW